MRKVADHFESISAVEGAFVPLLGSHHSQDAESVYLDDLLRGRPLGAEIVVSRPGAMIPKINEEDFVDATAGLRSFLTIIEPDLVTLILDRPGRPLSVKNFGFGIYLPDFPSIAVVRSDRVEVYGTTHAEQRLRMHLERWDSLGQPLAAAFRLALHRGHAGANVPHTNEWAAIRRGVTLRWHLPEVGI